MPGYNQVFVALRSIRVEVRFRPASNVVVMNSDVSGLETI